MELKPGYKQTEVGVIPEDWESGKIADLNPFVTSGSRGWAEYYADYGHVFLRITNLYRNSIYVNLSDLRYVVLPPSDKEGVRTELRDRDLLISITADIGIIGYVDSSIPKPAYINQHIALIRLDSLKTNSKFLSYYLASATPQKLFRASTDQGAKAGMNLSGIRNIKIAIPPLLEQEAIAEALSDADALIETLERLVAKKRQIKQGAMQELLTGKTRLEGFSGDWEVKKLGEICSIEKGQMITEKNSEHGDFPVIAGGKKPAYFHNKSNRNGKTITISASGANAGYIGFFTEPIFASDCSTISENINYQIDFIYFQLKMNQSNIYKAQTGGAQPHIHPTDLKPILIGYPSLLEQEAIAGILSDMNAEIATLEKKLEKARAIKQGMMYNLLTGRIRLV